MAKIDVKIDDAKVQAAIDRLLDKASDGGMKPVFEVVGRKIKAKVQLGFRSGVAPSGKRWAPLRFRNGQPLLDTGRLRNAIVANATGQYVDVGTNIKYAPVHQFGAVIKPKKAKRLVFPSQFGLVFAKQVSVPARPFLPLDAAGNVDLPPQWAGDVLSALRRHFNPGT